MYFCCCSVCYNNTAVVAAAAAAAVRHRETDGILVGCVSLNLILVFLFPSSFKLNLLLMYVPHGGSLSFAATILFDYFVLAVVNNPYWKRHLSPESYVYRLYCQS